ncbi:uncharacterized protein LOC113864424 isoform X2 [Abrus precatorius]|uniref:Uncharacterized protein LOC113864424 isoform X2 n=1 Tax=Abrus precatorius TaxID=3816 RepID=A0A8B8LF31_ABRPR|nr:uncharacterized protein LOC113864424 isoform X2 [Abrus precatorius]
MDSEEDGGCWVLEFLLGNPLVESNLIKKVLWKITVPNADSRLKKTILLKTLQHYLSTVSIAESILQTLEILEELLRLEGSPITAAMSAAYCAVAVECTLKYLQLELNDNPAYHGAVERIWRGRVRWMDPSMNASREGSLLFSAELKRWRNDIEASLLDSRLRERLASSRTRRNAVRKLKVYLAEAMQNLGPSFLEVAASMPANNGRIDAVESMRAEDDGIDAETRRACSGTHELTHPKRVSPVEIQRDNKLFEAKGTSVAAEEAGPSTSRCKNDSVPKGACVATHVNHELTHQERVSPVEILKDNKLSEAKDTGTGAEEVSPSTTCSKVDSATNCEVQKAGESHEVEDPILNSLHMSGNARAELAKKDMNQEPPIENQSRDADVSFPRTGQRINNNDDNLNEGTSVPQKGDQRPSLMEKNNTACTYEWNDAIDGLQGGTSNPESRFHFPSPKRRKLSPLKKYEPANITRRRKPKKWSVLEEQTLRTAVDKFGKGNWKLILNSHKDIFEDRTEVDLKDKWRNMMRYGCK